MDRKKSVKHTEKLFGVEEKRVFHTIEFEEDESHYDVILIPGEDIDGTSEYSDAEYILAFESHLVSLDDMR